MEAWQKNKLLYSVLSYTLLSSYMSSLAFRNSRSLFSSKANAFFFISASASRWCFFMWSSKGKLTKVKMASNLTNFCFFNNLAHLQENVFHLLLTYFTIPVLKLNLINKRLILAFLPGSPNSVFFSSNCQPSNIFLAWIICYAFCALQSSKFKTLLTKGKKYDTWLE